MEILVFVLFIISFSFIFSETTTINNAKQCGFEQIEYELYRCDNNTRNSKFSII